MKVDVVAVATVRCLFILRLSYSHSNPKFIYCDRRHFRSRYKFVYFVFLAESTKFSSLYNHVRMQVYVTLPLQCENLYRMKVRERQGTKFLHLRMFLQ